jgi:thiol-disulfide isomerase/thioredoxin
MNMTRVALLLVVTVAVSCGRGEKPAPAKGAVGYGTTAGQTQSAAPRGAEAHAAGTDVGAAMPEYGAMWLDGSKFELSGKRDKVVLLNVWATWCGPCRFEIPELQAIHDRYAAKGFEVIGVSVDESGVESVRQFVDEQKMRYPIAVDPEGKIATLLHTDVLPTSILLDRNGRIVWKKYQAITPNDAELQKAIEAAL